MATEDFYDMLAPIYHLIYADWEAGIERQGDALDGIIHAFFGDRDRSVLDVACGIGTQSLGLARLGYAVTGSDISSGAVARARDEAGKRGLAPSFSVADMRGAYSHHQREFDVVICADNSLPHLLSEGEIGQALAQLFRCTRPGGLCLVSLRDYTTVERAGTQVKPYRVHAEGSDRWILLQVWDWHDKLYDLSLYAIRDDGSGSCETRVARTTYLAIKIARLAALMREAGFVDVRRDDDAFFQPLLIAARQRT